MGQPGLEPPFIWGASTADRDLRYYTTAQPLFSLSYPTLFTTNYSSPSCLGFRLPHTVNLPVLTPAEYGQLTCPDSCWRWVKSWLNQCDFKRLRPGARCPFPWMWQWAEQRMENTDIQVMINHLQDCYIQKPRGALYTAAHNSHSISWFPSWLTFKGLGKRRNTIDILHWNTAPSNSGCSAIGPRESKKIWWIKLEQWLGSTEPIHGFNCSVSWTFLKLSWPESLDSAWELRYLKSS